MNWISVGERLPNEHMDVLLTVKARKTSQCYVMPATWSYLVDLETGEIIGKQSFTYIADEDGHAVMIDILQNKEIKILAWMPYPEPYKDEFRVIVAGSRTFNDYEFMKEKLDRIFANHKPTSIVCGEAKGADTLGRKYAEEHGIKIDSFPADWTNFGKQAGFIRNEQMANNADALVAFSVNNSSGTRHMINTAKKQGLQVRVINYEA